MLRSTPSSNICWQCRWRLANQKRRFPQRTSRKDGIVPGVVSSLPRRALHATRSVCVSQTETASSIAPAFDPALLNPSRQKLTTRQHLQMWNEKFGGPDEETLSAFENHPAHSGIQNNVAKLNFASKADENLEHGTEQTRDEEDEGEELVTIGLFLKPGDVVELSRAGREPVLAVFVQQLGLISQFYSVNGRWTHSNLNRISFAVPGAIDPALLQPLVPYLPTKLDGLESKNSAQVPRDLGAPVRDMLHKLTEDSERIYRTNAPILDTAYSTLADTTRTRMMTLSQIAKTLLAKSDPTWLPSPPALLAVRKALTHNEYRFRADARSQRLTNVFAIRPKNDVELVETVQEWVREYREYEAALANSGSDTQRRPSVGARYVLDFVDKARRLIAQSRNRRQPRPGFTGPDQSQGASTQPSQGIRDTVWGEDFSKTDQQIINFLQAWVLNDQFANIDHLHSACASILHATGCYHDMSWSQEGDILNPAGKSSGYLLLQEVGVITPFENRALYNENLMLPTVRLSRNLELLSTKAELTRKSPDFRDAMADLRRDWGLLTVFCIDAADAKEIDDGVSIERVPSKPSEYWIHVHVANPTAFFDKTHVLSGLAAHMTETVYTPERSFAMIPSWASQNYFSLDNNRPVITFSTRIDDAGNMLESKIQHGVIRKVVSITPTELAKYLDDEFGGRQGKQLVVGGELPTEKTVRPLPRLTAEQLQNLRDMYAAAQSLWKGRKAAGAVRFGYTTVGSVSVYEKPHMAGLNWKPPSLERARRMVGDPIIEVRGGSSRSSGDTGFMAENIDSSNIVEEMMLLACRTAGSWCAERNIPVMFRGTVESPISPLSLVQFREKILLPALERPGGVSRTVQQQYLAALGRAIAHSSPLPHNIIGAKAYLKATSPLRRFSDMITHWQIEAALRYEARTGQKLNAKIIDESPRPILPFSQRQMQESIITLSPREQMIRATTVASDAFWSAQAFMRAFHYQEAPLPEAFEVEIHLATNDGRSRCTLEGFDTRGFILDFPGMEYRTGDRWEAKIHHVDAYHSRIWFEPVRLIHREESV
ncbi:RNB-domain-containing protein [Bimuria novae-zelandiae CBS 107.79]|uniref:RNB-domain-containing protein n=1 Tax=Bimuria novae-zelandiae CBS 107.79 TaxID=1447943 RepID=A0A6A5VQR9_9PLEO|nr:RNB-domain-containing protein [Bimuria novae-zelandiae CBS 107.79]